MFCSFPNRFFFHLEDNIFPHLACLWIPIFCQSCNKIPLRRVYIWTILSGTFDRIIPKVVTKILIKWEYLMKLQFLPCGKWFDVSFKLSFSLEILFAIGMLCALIFVFIWAVVHPLIHKARKKFEQFRESGKTYRYNEKDQTAWVILTQCWKNLWSESSMLIWSQHPLPWASGFKLSVIV